MNEFYIWDTDKEVASQHSVHSHLCVFQSLRIAGNYKIPIDVSRNIKHRCALMSQNEPERVKARLATVLIDRIEEGGEEPLIDSQLVNYVFENSHSLPVANRARRLLRHMTRPEFRVGATFQFWLHQPTFEIALGVSESINDEELTYFLNYLKEAGFIRGNDDEGFYATVQGYETVRHVSERERSNRVFVAMWFVNEMDEIWRTIKSVVEQAGYEPIRVDLENHEGLIDDKIVSEIRSAKFVIADLTHDEQGHRGSVYYETGFARGLNKPVIQTVREDLLKNNKLAFDASHYPVISWCFNDLNSFSDALLNRIQARFGKSNRSSS